MAFQTPGNADALSPSCSQAETSAGDLAGDSPRTPLADQDQDLVELVELVTELVEQLSEAGALPQQRRVDVSGLPVGPDPAAEERQTREELRFVETSIAVLEDAGDVGDIELYTATFPEVEAADPSIRERM